MQAVIQKPDLDTCLTALLLGIGAEDTVTVLPGAAAPEVLADPSCICIEAGGSGQTYVNNFDHHDPNHFFPPACRQAFQVSGNNDPVMERLVEYVSMVDDPPPEPLRIPYPSLSNLFSGMRMVTPQPLDQFGRGMELLRTVYDEGLDPFASMPMREEWRSYLEAKEENVRRIEESGVMDKILYFTTASCLKAGYLELAPHYAGLIIGPGTLYREGCDIAIIFSPAFGTPPVRKFTIAGNNRPVSRLLDEFCRYEPGWGGRETIIGSPFSGTDLTREHVVSTVRCL